MKLSLKSLNVTRWSCRWEAVKAVYRQMERIVKALLTLSSDKDPITHSDSKALLKAICDFEFIFGFCVLKIILSNTNSLWLCADIFKGRRSTLSPPVDTLK